MIECCGDVGCEDRIVRGEGSMCKPSVMGCWNGVGEKGSEDICRASENLPICWGSNMWRCVC